VPWMMEHGSQLWLLLLLLCRRCVAKAPWVVGSWAAADNWRGVSSQSCTPLPAVWPALADLWALLGGSSATNAAPDGTPLPLLTPPGSSMVRTAGRRADVPDVTLPQACVFCWDVVGPPSTLDFRRVVRCNGTSKAPG
jgi:hypothetical protein